MAEILAPPTGTAFENRLVRLLDTTLGVVLAVLVFLMMTLTFCDVVGRGFNAPVPAAFEITEVMMAFVVYLGLPVVCARREHIAIGLFEHMFKGVARRIQNVTLNLLLGVLCLFWAREVWIQANALAAANELLMFLQVQIAPYVYVMAVLTVLAALVFLTLAVRAAFEIMRPAGGD